MRCARPTSVIIGFSAALLTLGACNSDGRTLRPAGPDQTASVYTTTTSSTVVASLVEGASTKGAGSSTDLPFVLNLAWEDGGVIEARYTCDGGDVQPGFSWLGAPAGAVEMALVVTDVDANNFVHWVVAGLDPADPLVAENSLPASAIEGTNDFPADPAASGSATGFDVGWRGPCPPAGQPHTYLFRLYALSQKIELPAGSAAADLQAAIDATSLEVAQLTGVYPGT